MAGNSAQGPRTVLEHLLRQQDRTYEEVAAEFERLARGLGERGVTISPRHLRRLASGERSGTTPSTRRVLNAMFAIPVDELLRPWEGGGGRSATSKSETEMLEMAAEQSHEFAFNRDLPMSGEAIERLHDEVVELASLYPVRPLPTILGRLVNTQATILSLLDRRQTPANARRLYFMAAVTAGLLAYAGNDIAKPELALTHARAALLWAEYTDHPGLRAWIRALQSFICYWADRPREALRYAELGTQSAVSASSSASTWLYAGHARAWAALGNAEQAKELLHEADAAAERARPDDLDALGGLCTFGRPRQLYYAGRTLASLPEESADAERFAVEAIEAYRDPQDPTFDFTCEADSRIALALARASRGELDGVADSLAPVFALPPESRIHDLVQTMHLVHRGLNRFDTSAARDLQEEIEDFSQASLPQFPR
ncbi:hypothetical protein [Dactylosporangium darangshiense]|uniref:XRE family transcriptional regulator n=1 Tax=Dactylosporangium darangshiense TaxID=579108 RepID=A0ABP8DRZ6_9ACTN